MLYGVANRDPRGVRSLPRPSTCDAIPTRTSASAGQGRTSASARTSPAARSPWPSVSSYTRLPDLELTGDPVPLDAIGIPLVGGLKRLPVRFTPTARVGS